MKADGTRPPFDQIANVPPVSSGAYLIEQRKNDKQITYKRNPRYWAATLRNAARMLRRDTFFAAAEPCRGAPRFKGVQNVFHVAVPA